MAPDDLPGDNHVHSQWSWDAVAGSMWRTCERAVELGVPAVAFTEHADFTPWTVDLGDRDPDDLPAPWTGRIVDGVFRAPALDVDGYLACVDSCREAFSSLQILTGLELSEPHRQTEPTVALLARARFDRVLASVHALADGAGFRELGARYELQKPQDVVRDYLAEVIRLAEGFDGFEVLAHIDYPIRYWPGGPAAFDPAPLAEPFREALSALARSGRALEINTRIPLTPAILGWWHGVGGQAVTFGSDAHRPDAVARGFVEAAAMARGYGFRPGRRPYDPWPRG
jgi:histidinol-phosphatase (PHP family)